MGRQVQMIRFLYVPSCLSALNLPVYSPYLDERERLLTRGTTDVWDCRRTTGVLVGAGARVATGVSVGIIADD